MVSEGWNLLIQNWLSILLIGAAFLAVTVAVLVTVAVQASSALDPGFFTIIERFAEPGFDPVNDPADEAFVDSISFSPTLAFWVTVVVGGLMVLVAQGFALGVAQIHLAAASVDRPLTLGESFRLALGRLPRWIAIYLLWMLVFLGGALVVAVLFFLAAQFPILFLLVIPAAIGFFVYAYPFVWLATTSLVLGRVGDPPFRTTVALIKAKGWSAVAGPVFIANLLVIGVNFAAGLLGVIPLLGQIVALVAQVLLYALPAALNIPIWRMLGGAIAPDISGAADGSGASATGG